MHEQTGFLNNDFRTSLYHVMEHGTDVFPRGTVTKELMNYNITLKDPRNRVITFPERKTNMAYLLGEFIWYISGSNDPAGILPYSKFWLNITNSGEHDGYPAGTVNSNYGNRLFGHSVIPALWEGNIQPINQWDETVQFLAADKDSRQAILNIHLPSDRHAGNKDVACTLTLQFLIRENKLHLIVNMRSNDSILGFTNDVFQFTMLQEAMLVNLKGTYPDLELGHYFHNAGSYHVYEKHFKMASEIIANEKAYDASMIPMQSFTPEDCDALIQADADWVAAGKPEEFDFDKYDELDEYWITVLKAFYLQDHDAMHKIFGQEHDEV